MTMRTGPVPPDITAAVETYVRSELTAAVWDRKRRARRKR